jgi:hypothetical protein
MNNTTHLVAVVCTTIPATDTRPARVKLTLPRFKRKVIVPWDYSLAQDSAYAQAAHWLNSRWIKHCAFLDLGDLGDILAVEWEQVPQLLELFKNKKPNKYKNS